MTGAQPPAEHCLARLLEACYERYNSREAARRDPVWFVHRHEDPLDREIAGLVAASLAYGRLQTIMSAVGGALERLGDRPRRFLLDGTEGGLARACEGFRHRFTGAGDLARLLAGIRRVLLCRGSLKECFLRHAACAGETIMPAAAGFVAELSREPLGLPHLLPSPRRGSACKRLCLFLRWMVRRDEVDAGDWREAGPERLVVPMDTHMARVCAALGFTPPSGAADLRAALRATAAFRRIRPDDPARYDFALMHASVDGGPDFLRALAAASGGKQACGGAAGGV